MLVILEGLDKCGKTTFANRFAEHAEIIHSTKDDDPVIVLSNAVKLAASKLVILDRSFLSEMCYGPVYRGEMTIMPAKMMKITKLLKSIEHCILYFSRPDGSKVEYDYSDEFEQFPDKLKLVETKSVSSFIKKYVEKRYKQYISMYKNRFNIYEVQYK